MAPVSDQSPETNSQQSLSIQQIIDTVSNLYELSAKANESIGQHVSDSNFLAFLARCGGRGTVSKGEVSLGKKINDNSTSTTNSSSGKNDNTSDKSKMGDGQSLQHLNSGTSLAQLQMLSINLSFMVNALTELKKLEDGLGKPIPTLDSKLRSYLDSKLTVDQMKPMLQKINKEITSLKGQIPYPLKIASEDDDSPQELQVSNEELHKTIVNDK